MTHPLNDRIETAAFAFRGYDITNLGRSPELLAHPAYRRVVRAVLNESSSICSDVLGRRVDLARRIRARSRSHLATFALDVATIVAMEIAQLRLLTEFFGVALDKARLSFGYSIGELSALVLGKVFALDQILSVPLRLAADCAELAEDAAMGVLFAREHALEMDEVERLCVTISSRGTGLIGPSARLSPNTILLLGQGDTIDRFREAMPDHLPARTLLRRNPNQWPPLHTPLVWRRNIPSRAAVALFEIDGGLVSPTPPVVSLATGAASYNDYNSREILTRWTDHPQLLWSAVTETLTRDVELVIHVGPEPNVIPATFQRLSDNVRAQLGGRFLGTLGRRVISEISRSWLINLLSADAALLRAPFLEHVVLENWLLDQKPA